MAIRETKRRRALVSSGQHTPTKRSFDSFEHAAALARKIPADEVARMPRDGARNLDHYLDGSPKQK